MVFREGCILEEELVVFAGGSDVGCVTEEEESRRTARFSVGTTAEPFTEVVISGRQAHLGPRESRVWCCLCYSVLN